MIKKMLSIKDGHSYTWFVAVDIKDKHVDKFYDETNAIRGGNEKMSLWITGRPYKAQNPHFINIATWRCGLSPSDDFFLYICINFGLYLLQIFITLY